MNPLKQLTTDESIIRARLAYSHFHRPESGFLPKWCKLADGDWFEMRDTNRNKTNPVACIETMQIQPLFIQTAQKEYELWDTKKELLVSIQDRMDIPVYIVRHTPDLYLFAVSRLITNGEETSQVLYNKLEYSEFIMNLGGNHQ